MTQLKDLSAEQFVQRYNPALNNRGFVTSEQWSAVRPFVLKAIAPVAHLKATSLRPFLAALTRIAAFAHHNGQRLTVEVVLSPAMVRAFLVTTKKGERDFEPQLWRLSKAWGLTPLEATVRDGVRRPTYLTPYSRDEFESLLHAADNQATGYRRITLLAIIFLGAGAGVRRSTARDVTASDVHTHSDGEWFVCVGAYCAKVRPEFIELATELISLRPKGRLRGTADPTDVVAHATAWLRGRRGVPALSADRLRATYVCALLREGVGLVDLLNWLGLASAEALDGYLEHAAVPQLCDRLTGSPS
jgi:integrase